jgi:hypothetical protein
MTFQLVPPRCHMHTAAERAIRSFKEHFVAGLTSVDPDFPMQIWYRLLPQADITLNLLWTSILCPQLSAAAHFHGLVDYNKTAFARQVARSLHMKSHHKGERGHPMASQYIK